MFSHTKQLCEELYPDYQAKAMTSEQEEILAKEHHYKCRAWGESMPTINHIKKVSRSASPSTVVSSL